MKLSDTTNYLYATVDEWSYVTDWSHPRSIAAQTEAMMKISGTTRYPFGDLAQLLPISLCLVDDELGEEECEINRPWQLDLIDDLHDYDIPTMLEGLLTLPKAVLADVKECLFRAARTPGCMVQFRLETREQLTRAAAEDGVRRFSLLAFGYDVNYQKENV